jgi:phosphate transport system substrate-binding protein
MRKLLNCMSVVFVVALAGCGGGSTNTENASGAGDTSPAKSEMLNVKGSDTMVNLSQAWAETYMGAHPGAQIAVTGGGTGTGIAALQNHTTDVAMASRDIKSSEKEQIEKGGGSLQEFTVARDALTVGVNPANPVKSLNFDQLSDIFTGKVTDWSQVGGKPGKIVALSREKSSGTHVFFLEHVIRKGDSKSTAEYAPGVLMLPSSQAIVAEVAKNPNAIGYYGLGYHKPEKLKAVEIAAKAGAPAVAPSEESVLKGTYPVSRPLHLYTARQPEGLAREFIDYCNSAEGQKLVVDQGFVPVADEAAAKPAAK